MLSPYLPGMIFFKQPLFLWLGMVRSDTWVKLVLFRKCNIKTVLAWKEPPRSVLCSWNEQYTTHLNDKLLLVGKGARTLSFTHITTYVYMSILTARPRMPKLATPIHWINPSYLLIKSCNHGLDPFHWFVSRHGRAEGHRNAALANPRCETRADKLIYAWKCVPKWRKRTKGASIFPFL